MHLQRWKAAAHEKARMDTLGLLSDLFQINAAAPRSHLKPQTTPSTVTSAKSRRLSSALDPYMPLEADPVEAILISMDDQDSYEEEEDRNTTRMWATIIKAAQSQNISVISYVATKAVEIEDTLERILGLLSSDPDINVTQILFMEDYLVNSIWMRDYSPIFFMDPTTPADYALDELLPSSFHVSYFTDRPRDMGMADSFADDTQVPLHFRDLLFEGGNLISNGNGLCIMSDRVLYVSYRGTDLSLAERKADLHYQLEPFGCIELIVVESLSYDITGHVDMWMSFANETTLVLGHYRGDQSPLDQLVFKHNKKLLEHFSNGTLFSIAEVPMPSLCPLKGVKAPSTCLDIVMSTDHPENLVSRTYMNVVQLNDLLLMPYFDEDKKYEAKAIQAWEAVADGRYKGKVVPVGPADSLIGYHGSVHCITRTIPKGTLAPTFVADKLQEQRAKWQARGWVA